ncbi:hypothetical protein DM02DRAFT_652954 [Periconia macrospinosa]|uniref:Rhodopsin domain-containing protein n=1 Tax=Periconia macrospinosa TaxID=97972 RepID=A0A2V1DY69_9PLEO|nr:hypothetical protein DM02DRAFT_652954 [Periconia macrospinosa]
MSQGVVPPTPAATVAAGIVFPLVEGVMVGLRFYWKHVQRAGYYAEDWLTIPALLFTTGMGVSKRGLSYLAPQPKDPKDLPTFVSPDITAYRQLQYSLEMMHCLAVTFVKLSFLLFYHRIFVTPMQPVVKWLVWILIVLCTLWGLGFLFNFMFACGMHFADLWTNLATFKRSCQRIVDVNFWLGITDCILDILIFIFPIPLVWGLHMSTTRKIGVLAVFCVGAVTVAASITRMVLFIRVVHNIRVGYTKSGIGADLLTLTAGLYWKLFETGMALISVCLPFTYTFYKRWKSKNTSTFDSSSNQRLGNSISGFRQNRKQRLEDSTENIIPLENTHVVVTTDIQIQSEPNVKEV